MLFHGKQKTWIPADMFTLYKTGPENVGVTKENSLFSPLPKLIRTDKKL